MTDDQVCERMSDVGVPCLSSSSPSCSHCPTTSASPNDDIGLLHIHVHSIKSIVHIGGQLGQLVYNPSAIQTRKKKKKEKSRPWHSPRTATSRASPSREVEEVASATSSATSSASTSASDSSSASATSPFIREIRQREMDDPIHQRNSGIPP